MVSFNFYIKFDHNSFDCCFFYIFIIGFLNFFPQHLISNYFYIKCSSHSFYYYFFYPFSLHFFFIHWYLVDLEFCFIIL
jgi:hypothetical protein